MIFLCSRVYYSDLNIIVAARSIAVAVHVGFMVGGVALGQFFVKSTLVFSVIIIPTVLHTYISFIYYQC
jgi:hypothetical protein